MDTDKSRLGWRLLPGAVLSLFLLIGLAPIGAIAGDTKDTNAMAQSAVSPTNINAGQKLFLKNCAVCHGADAHGDDGPDLHDLDLPEAWIANRIRKGKKGQMTAFAGKLQPAEIDALVAYVRGLK